MKAGIYQHYKGPKYHVLEIVRHSETEEELVLYRALYGDFGLWVRPKSMFEESVTIDKESLPRFKLIEEKPSPLQTNHLKNKE